MTNRIEKESSTHRYFDLDRLCICSKQRVSGRAQVRAYTHKRSVHERFCLDSTLPFFQCVSLDFLVGTTKFIFLKPFAYFKSLWIQKWRCFLNDSSRKRFFANCTVFFFFATFIIVSNFLVCFLASLFLSPQYRIWYCLPLCLLISHTLCMHEFVLFFPISVSDCVFFSSVHIHFVHFDYHFETDFWRVTICWTNFNFNFVAN